MKLKTSIWVEKYRPHTLAEVVFQDERQRNTFLNFIENKDIPHLLLYGVQGTGKTSISLALLHDLGIDDSDIIKVNCSKESIDAIRGKVYDFAMTMPLGDFKVVRLEEMDYLSQPAQALLRDLIEETSGSCRYIATCNYVNKIIPPMRSRFQDVYFKAPDQEKVALRMVDILDAEKIDYDPENVLAYIDIGYPDIRKIIQLLQGNSQKGKLLPVQDADAGSDWRFGLLDALVKGDWKAARAVVCQNATREEHSDVYTFLYQNAKKLKVQDPDSAIITLAEYHYRHSLASDTELILAACFIALSKS